MPSMNMVGPDMFMRNTVYKDLFGDVGKAIWGLHLHVFEDVALSSPDLD